MVMQQKQANEMIMISILQRLVDPLNQSRPGMTVYGLIILSTILSFIIHEQYPQICIPTAMAVLQIQRVRDKQFILQNESITKELPS